MSRRAAAASPNSIYISIADLDIYRPIP
jgi:hypothetical protein